MKQSTWGQTDRRPHQLLQLVAEVTVVVIETTSSVSGARDILHWYCSDMFIMIIMPLLGASLSQTGPKWSSQLDAIYFMKITITTQSSGRRQREVHANG